MADITSASDGMNKEAKNYLDDAMALRAAAKRHYRLKWYDSSKHLWAEARSRLGLCRMWYKGNVK